MAYNRERAAASDTQWEKQFGETQKQNEIAANQWEKQFGETQRQNDIANEQWRQQFGETQKQNEISNNQWAQQFGETQRQNDISNEQWNKSFEQSQKDTAWQQAFQQNQQDLAYQEWVTQFNHNNWETQQQLAMTWAQNVAANGGDVSDDLLAKAGLSRADFNAMKKQAASGGGTNNNNNNNNNTNGNKPWEQYGMTEADWNKMIEMLTGKETVTSNPDSFIKTDVRNSATNALFGDDVMKYLKTFGSIT